MNDLISRQDMIDVLDVGAELLRRVLDDADIVGVERAKYEWGLNLIESYIADVKELPSAQPERKRGCWVVIDDEPCDVYKCDQCGTTYDTVDNTWGLPYFCPNCGSDMRG